MSADVERLSLRHHTDDNFPLSLSIFRPKDPAKVCAVVVFANATGVQARFYHSFASWLSAHGITAYSFDYRYTGTSFPLHWDPDRLVDDEDYYQQALHECPPEYDITNTWGRKDLASMVQLAYESYPHVDLTVIGHSMGGHLMIILPRSHIYGPKAVIKRFLNICGGNAYYKNRPNPEEAEFGFTEMVVKPLAEERIFRASNMGLGYDLPFGPGREWIDWFFHPHFAFGRRENLDLARSFLNIPLLYVGFQDDSTISKLMMEKYMGTLNHSDGKKRSLWVNPEKRGWPVCGHVNAFTKSKSSNPTPVEHGEGYAPHDLSLLTQPRSHFGREETVWRLFLSYILGQDIDIAGDEYRLWKVEDQRDVEKEREEEIKATAGQPNRFDKVLLERRKTRFRL